MQNFKPRNERFVTKDYESKTIALWEGKIIFELSHYFKGDASRSLLDQIMKNTRKMFEQQKAVRGHLFMLQDVMQYC
ncbi:hypothetical protein LINPERPRIM_LOCUS7481, partial [Linum perenne]